MVREVRELGSVELHDDEVFRNLVLEPCQPVVLRGLVADWPSVAAGRQGAGSLSSYLDQFDIGSRVGVFRAPSALDGKFFYNEAMSGFNFDRSMMALREAIELIVLNARDDAAQTVYAGSIPISDCLPGFAAQNHLRICPEEKARLWLGNAANVATHYDAMDNVACVIAGQRRFTLFTPDSIANLYVGPIDNTMAGRPVSLASVENHAERYPRFEAIRDQALFADLEPGDAIYIPKLWWHQVEAHSQINGMVNYWWDAFAAGPDEPYTALLLSMIILAERPETERAAWRAYYDHYVFRLNGHPLAHLPTEMHGILGPLKSNYGRIRAAVLQLLRNVGGG